MNWEFSFDFQLNSMAVMSELISIEAYKEAASNLVLPADWREQLDRLNRVRAIHGTTALEGNPLSEAEVSQQIDLIQQPQPEDATRQRVTKEQRQIRNAGIAQEWVRMRFDRIMPPCRFQTFSTCTEPSLANPMRTTTLQGNSERSPLLSATSNLEAFTWGLQQTACQH